MLVDPEKFENNILRQNRLHERNFEFDASFGLVSTQQDVHETTTKPIVDAVINGYNATVFAYGATGSGKTYTMIGTRENPGLMTLMTKTLYERLDDQYQLNLSYLEIYNEVIRDLLNPSGPDLDLLEDDKGNIRVPGLSSVRAPNLTRIMQILQEGNLRRTQESTQANQTSSRSHAVLQVMIMKNNSLFSKLFMIDLAGSERASNTQNRGIRLKEGAAINRSLLALGNVINSLSTRTTRYVNYRDSKLTRLLKDSLGGTARTCMIAHVTPASGNFEESYNTLTYAGRAKNITNKMIRNRPASADQFLNENIKAARKSITSGMKNSISTTTLAKPESTERRPRAGILRNVNAVNTNDKRQSQALFTQLKTQYMNVTEKQMRLREKLMNVNSEAYSIEMGIVSKGAIVDAWSKQGHGNQSARPIEKLREDVEAHKKKLGELEVMREKIEKALRKGEESSKMLEKRMNPLATTSEQQEVVKLLVKMSHLEAQKICALNDLAIQDLIMNKTDASISKLHKYEMLADKLIDGNLQSDDRKKLEEEYRVIKNQFHYHLLPLKSFYAASSWNSMLFPSISGNTSDPTPTKYRRKPESIKLPAIGSRETSISSDSTESSDASKK